jgi:hypothetical protein
MNTSSIHRPFQVRSSKRDGIEVDQTLIDRTGGKMDFQTDTELHDARWARFNADVDEDQVDQAQHYERQRIKKLCGKYKIPPNTPISRPSSHNSQPPNYRIFCIIYQQKITLPSKLFILIDGIRRHR